MHINPEIDAVIERAVDLARQKNHAYVMIEHVVLAMLQDAAFQNLLKDFGTDMDRLTQELDQWLDQVISPDLDRDSAGPRKTNSLERVFNRALAQVLFTGRKTMTMLDLYVAIMAETNSHAHYFLIKHGVNRRDFMRFMERHPDARDLNQDQDQALAVLREHCENLTDMARQDQLEPVIGRDSELQEIVVTLARRFKSNVLMVGDAGVGKTAIAEGLARAIVNQQVPAYLRDHEVWSLEIGSLLAGSRYRGDFEEKITNIIQALKTRRRVVLFIDEAHTMRGAGSNNNSGADFANMLKPAMASGQIKILASTTWEEYYESFEKDRALMRRFRRLDISEPGVEVTREIMLALKPRLEKFHGVAIDDEAVSEAVVLTHRYITDRRNPDKSIDVIDAAAARERVTDRDLARVTPDLVRAQVSRMTQVPVDRFDRDQVSRTRDLDAEIRQRLHGQDEVVDQVLERVYMSMAGLGPTQRPMASFLFVGPTGTGKTELARLLAQHLDMQLLKYDMSEYQERHSVSALIGAPPGYVGFDDGNLGGGRLISDLSRNPHAVILFDEIEKAHPDLINILLQLLDEARLTSTAGKTVDCRNTIVIMTSNLGARDNENNNMGFTQSLERQGMEDKAMRDFFRPELRNRIDQICRFRRLDRLAVKKIVIKFIDQLRQSLVDRGITIDITEPAVELLADRGHDPLMGARPLNRRIDELVRVPLSRKILFQGLRDQAVIIAVRDQEICLEIPGLGGDLDPDHEPASELVNG